MKHFREIVFGAILAACTLPHQAVAQDFDAGMAAWGRGDYQAALNEFRPLAELGDASGQISLGLMYLNGDGLPQDYTEAARLLRLAAEQGHAFAHFSLGSMYFDGQGVPKDYTEAARLFRLAAEQGLASAQSYLGFMYFDGQGVPQDYESAYVWHSIAAASGADSAKFQDQAASKLTPEALNRAKQRSRICFESNFQNCD